MQHHENQSGSAQHLTEGTTMTVQEMAISMGDKVQKMVAKDKEEKEKAKDRRSMEIEKEGIRKQLERRLDEEEKDSYGKPSIN